MKIFYSCLEDYDMAIDDFILEYETFPLIEKDEDHVCDYCKERSTYRLRKMEDVADHSDDMV
jgi:CxxH/CxxC protein (TIGR04129 family)